ncbi:MAG TPA: tetratricopeptide repeat protein [Xanthomonadaceae bacterium]|jgi:predicted negative regulator of RcsB-dependent stress response|nr:tetratricopeptide repeat protein [Xanthomonadaceae bacterium]
MAIDDQEEYEQGEQIRNWLRANGGSMIGGIAVGLILIAGWQWWQRKQELHAEDGANAYAALSTAINAGTDEKRIDAAAQTIRSDYAKTPYATLAALRIAAHQLDRNDAKGALATLDSIGTISDDPALSMLVQLRASRLLLILGRPTDALARIASVKDPAYASVADEIRGDADSALGHPDAAREDYVNALQQLPADAPGRAVLEMKLTDLGGVVPKPEAKKA